MVELPTTRNRGWRPAGYNGGEARTTQECGVAIITTVAGDRVSAKRERPIEGERERERERYLYWKWLTGGPYHFYFYFSKNQRISYLIHKNSSVSRKILQQLLGVV
jgi:hypothetical protein